MRLGHLGYAVTSFRAQGLTTDTAHVLVDASLTRESLYVAMTRGREANIAYVAVDRPDDSHSGPHPGDNNEVTAQSVLSGVLQHVGAELSAHEALTAEQETWATIAQLAAEYETIAAAAQRDRWASLVRVSGLSPEQADSVVDSDAFGPLTAELRRAEANHHDVERLLPRLIRARGFGDADDIAAVLRHRVATATARPAGSGRSKKSARLIAGLIPEATGTMSEEMKRALAERAELMEARVEAVLAAAIAESAPWVEALGAEPSDPRRGIGWRIAAHAVAAYRDRYRITAEGLLGGLADTTVQKVDRARAEAALRKNRVTETKVQETRSRLKPVEHGRQGGCSDGSSTKRTRLAKSIRAASEMPAAKMPKRKPRVMTWRVVPEASDCHETISGNGPVHDQTKGRVLHSAARN